MNSVFPLEFRTGLGYSPASAGPTGGWPPGTQFYGQNLDTVLPNGKLKISKSFFFGKKNKSRKRIKRRSFGYPLMNIPQKTIDMTTFPKYPIGPGNTSGGDGGAWFPRLPGSQSYWGYGKRKSSKKRKYSKKRKHSKKKSIKFL